MTLLYNPKNETLMTREMLHEVKTPPPQGPWHQPVPYGDFVEAVDKAMHRMGIEVVKEEYAVKHNGSRFFGLMEVALEGEYIPKDWSLQIGMRGSHDRTIPRALTLGSQVFVCSNMCFHGELGVLQTRQTKNVWDRLPVLIENAIARVPIMADRNRERFEHLRLTNLSANQGDLALVQLHRMGLLNSHQLATSLKEWAEPSFEEHAEDGLSAWRLFNATTQALKPAEGTRGNMVQLQQQSIGVSSFFDELIDLPII